MKFLTLILLTLSTPVRADSTYSWNNFQKEYSAVIYDQDSSKVLLTGSALTAGLVLFREGIVEPFQDENVGKIFGEDVADFGDLMGQVIPNALYMGGTYLHHKFTGNKKSISRSILMLKTTLYAGGTTTILKRIVNQRRPDKGDRLSFPSGHTTTAFAFASVVGMEHEWYWGVGAYSIASIVAMSRIHDNAHYLHDVVFGATLGIFYGVALYNLQNKNENIGISVLPINDGATIATSFMF